MPEIESLSRVSAGMPILFGGNRLVHVPAAVAERFEAGDSLYVVEQTGDLLHVPHSERATTTRAVDRAVRAFSALRKASDAQLDQFYDGFANNLESAEIWSAIAEANQADVIAAEARGRSTTRLVASAKLRADMVSGLRGWVTQRSRRGQIIEEVDHGDWQVQLEGAALGVIGFVFEGRPNVVADATGVLRGGNAVVFRIGSDALGTAQAILKLALAPALLAADLPEGAVSLVESSAHAAGWALFSDNRLSLAVARGSGKAVDTLGGLAQQAGIPVSLHGTGGAWMVAATDARPEALQAAVTRSLDRKVCNTLNTCCIPRSRAAELVPAFLAGLQAAGDALGQAFKLHVTPEAQAAVPAQVFERTVAINRAEGDVQEKQAQAINRDQLGKEWEWEQSPEVTLTLVHDIAEAAELFNTYSPHFVASLISDDADQHQAFFDQVDAPFVCDGFTRWVDGQYALNRPELGLSNWERGRLFGRAGVLSGDTVFTVRTRARNTHLAKK